MNETIKISNKKAYDRARFQRRKQTESYKQYMSSPKKKLGGIATAAITRALRAGIEYDKGAIWELVRSGQTTCPLCSVLFYSTSSRMSSASIDRIDNFKGYTKHNIALICHKCNTLKSDADIPTLERIIAYIRKGL